MIVSFWGWLINLIDSLATPTVVIAVVGQAVFSIVFQIRNNEQQGAQIEANQVALATLRNEMVNLHGIMNNVLLGPIISSRWNVMICNEE